MDPQRSRALSIHDRSSYLRPYQLREAIRLTVIAIDENCIDLENSVTLLGLLIDKYSSLFQPEQVLIPETRIDLDNFGRSIRLAWK
jgi:hypothetical protein